MNSELIKKEEQQLFTWQGGKTLQFFVYPKGSDGAGNGSVFEITSSTMDYPKTEYSIFQGYQRLLMVIDGETILSHENGIANKLKKYDFCKFDGNIQTFSEGLATDFEIIATDDCQIEMKIVRDAECDLKIVPCEGYSNFHYGFLCQGENCRIEMDNKVYELESGDYFSVLASENCKVSIKENRGKVLVSKVFFNV